MSRSIPDLDLAALHLDPKSPSSITPNLPSNLPPLYFRFHEDEPLTPTTAPAILAWKASRSPPSPRSSHHEPFFLFLHDYGSSSRIFDRVVSELTHPCLAIDLRGWGRSTHTRDESPHVYSIQQMKDEIAPVVDLLLQGEQFIIVGHGMGAKVAQLYAVQGPSENLLGLALLAPMPLAAWQPDEDMVVEYKKAYKDENIEVLEDFTREILTKCKIDEGDLTKFVEDGMKDTPLAKEAWFAYGMDEDYADGVIGVPVMVWVGEGDRIIPGKVVEREVGGRFFASLQLQVSDCGHLIPLEDPLLAEGLILFAGQAQQVRGKHEFK